MGNTSIFNKFFKYFSTPAPLPTPTRTHPIQIYRHKFDLAVKRSKVNLWSSVNKLGRAWVLNAIYQNSAPKLFGSGEEDFQEFLPYMDMKGIFFNCTEPFELIGNTLSIEGPCENCSSSFREVHILKITQYYTSI